MYYPVPQNVLSKLRELDPAFMYGQGQEAPAVKPTRLHYVNWLVAQWMHDGDSEPLWMKHSTHLRSLLWLHKRLLGAALVDEQNRPLRDEAGKVIQRDLSLSTKVGKHRQYITMHQLIMKLMADIIVVKKYRPDELFTILCHFPSHGDISVRHMLRPEREALQARRQRIAELEQAENGPLAHLFVPGEDGKAPVRVLYHSPGNLMLLEVNSHEGQIGIGGQAVTVWCNSHPSPWGLKMFNKYQKNGQQYVMLFPKTSSMYAANFDPHQLEMGNDRVLQFAGFSIDDHDNTGLQPDMIFKKEAGFNPAVEKAIPEMMVAVTDSYIARRHFDSNAIEGLFRLYENALLFRPISASKTLLPAMQRLLDVGDPRVYRKGLIQCTKALKNPPLTHMARLHVEVAKHALENKCDAHNEIIIPGLFALAASYHVMAAQPQAGRQALSLAYQHVPRIITEGDAVMHAVVLHAMSAETHPQPSNADSTTLSEFVRRFCPLIIEHTPSVPLAEAAAERMRAAGLKPPPRRPAGLPALIQPDLFGKPENKA